MSEQSPDSEKVQSADEMGKQAPPEPLQANFGVPVAAPAAELPKKQRFKLSRRSAIIVVILLLLGGGAGAYLYMKDNSSESADVATSQQAISIEGKNIQTVDDQPFADKFIPNYSDMRGYIEYGGEHWYATFTSIIITKGNSYRVYTTKQFKDITTFTGIVEYDKSVWVSGQGGAAKQVSDTEFKDYLNGESNVQLYVDKFDNTLYATTFNSVYVYDKSTDAFSEIDARNEAGHNIQLSFNKDYVIAADINRSDVTSPVRLYNKKSKTWSDTDTSMFGNTGISGIVGIDDKTLIYGRPKGYESCEQAGVVPTGDFYQVEENGSLTQLSELVELFKNNEAYTGPSSPTSLRGSRSCSEGSTEEFVVDLKVEDEKIVATNKVGLDLNSNAAFYTYQDRVTQLKGELGFSPKIWLTQSTADDVLSIWQDTNGVNTLYASKSVTKTVQKKYEKTADATRIVSCAGSEYAINGSNRSLDFNGPYLFNIAKLGSAEGEVLYETTNEPQYESVLPELDLANPGALCVDGKLVLLGLKTVGIFDPATKKLTTQPHGYEATTDATVISKDGTSFIFIDYTNKKLVSVGADVSKLVAIPVAAAAFTGGEDSYSTHLFLVNDEVAVFSSRGNKDSTRIVTISSKDGSVIEKTDVERVVVDGAAYDATRFILQYDNGETKLVDNKTLKGTTISKESSISSGDLAWFAIVKDPNSEFIFADGHVWFTATNWGVIAYKLQ